MIPIKLTFKGIYSYQQEQTIDFANLTASKLFGIFGPVGSGKSTILEAMTFALYDVTDRLLKKGDNRIYNMMNLKSSSLSISFQFRAGQNDDEYLFEVSAKRKKSNFDSMQPVKRRVFQKENGKWLPLEVKSAEKILGLSAKNFGRTIIIPQGRFSDFLTLAPKDRTRMMKDLFNLEQFELYNKVAITEKKNNEKLHITQGQLLPLENVKAEVLKEIKKSIEELSINLQRLDNEKKDKEKIEQKFAKLKDLFKKLDEMQKTFKELEMQRERFNEIDRKIKRFHSCIDIFQNDLRIRNENIKKLDKAKKNIQIKKQEKVSLNKNLEAMQAKFNKLKQLYDKRPIFNRQMEDLNRILIVKKRQVNLENIQKELNKEILKKKQNDNKIKKLQEQQIELENELYEIKKALPDLSILAEIKQWFIVNLSLKQALKKREKEEIDVSDNISAIQKEKKIIFPGALKNEFVDAAVSYSLEEILSLIQDRKIKFENQQNELQMKIEVLSLQEGLENYARNLLDGKPCPLCGSTDHPNIMNISDVRKELEKLHYSRKSKLKLQKNLEQIQKKIEKLHHELNIYQRSKIEIVSKKASELKELQKHTSQFHWNKIYFDDDTIIKKEFALAKEMQNNIENKEKKLKKTLKLLEKQQKIKDTIIDKINKLKQQESGFAAEIASLKEQLDTETSLKWKNIASEKVKQEIDNIKRSVKKVEKEFPELEKKQNNLRDEITRLTGMVSEQETQLKVLDTAFQKHEEKLQASIKKSEFASINEIETILSWEKEIEQNQKNLSEFQEKLLIAKTKYETIKANTEGQQYNEFKHNQVIVELKEINQKINKFIEERASFNAKYLKMNEELKTRKILEKQLKKLQLRAENLSTLKKLFKGSGFVNYISSVYLEDLCRAANNRFYLLTRKQLKLELNTDNSFLVRDFLNDGKLRSVKTLSGGQTFQAALSLALALADSIKQYNTFRHNFFFLDEGFGSQDKDSLQIVFKTLQKLTKEDRIVGVISHVEELRQEFNTFLTINRDPEIGSIITKNW